MEFVSLNGQVVDYERARVSPGDAGFLHGAGLFETMRARGSGGKVFRLRSHVQRLMRSAKELELDVELGEGQVGEMIAELLEANGLTDARVRLTVTRGDIHAATAEKTDAGVTVLITAGASTPYPAELYEKGMVVAISRHKQNPENPLTGHKTTSYMDRLVALREAQKAGAGEALWFTPGNETLAEGCISNVFIMDKAGLLVTPPLVEKQFAGNAGGAAGGAGADGERGAEGLRSRECRLCLPGVMRGVVCEVANGMGMIVHERGITVDDLLAAREVFLTNAIMAVMPVVRVERHEVGDGKVGELTRRLGVEVGRVQDGA